MIIDSKTNILITGCGGMLGESVFQHFKAFANVLATDIDLNEDWLEYLDVRDFKQYRETAVNFRPQIMMHLAALTDLEYCERHSAQSYLTNTIGVENAALIAKELDCTLIYIGTAGIFDGAKADYDDWDSPNPINVYGRSKWLGEQYVMQNLNVLYLQSRMDDGGRAAKR